VTDPGSMEVLNSHRSARFTDATSNLGWSVAFWAANALIAERATADARQVFITKTPISIVSNFYTC
jgi:hypothetical protein